MTTPRKNQTSLSDTAYYHVISRCVRRSFLCGTDAHTGTCYEHRREWIEDRIRLLTTVFSIDCCSYAVMSNHYHIVLKIDDKSPIKWSKDEIIQRWLCLHKGPLLVQKYQKGELLNKAELATLSDIVENWRSRLFSISEFMQQLNQVIARQANQEEACTGRFWEGRFKSHPLLTEEALLTAMAYVDLNPIRAKMAKTPEKSHHTSIKERIKPQFNLERALSNNPDIQPFYFQRFHVKPLAAFEGNIKPQTQDGILFCFKDYLTLVDTTGRIQRQGKRGFIDNNFLPILARLSINLDDWLDHTQNFESIFYQKLYFRKQKEKAA